MNYTSIKYIKKYLLFSLTSDVKKYINKKSRDLSNEIDVLLKSLGYILPIPKGAIITRAFLKRLITIGAVGYTIWKYDKNNRYIAEKYLEIFNKNFKKIKEKKIIFIEIQQR